MESKKIAIPGYNVWGDKAPGTGNGLGGVVWRVEKDGSVILVVETRTTRQRRKNWDGLAKVQNRTEATVTVRLGYRTEYTLPNPYIVYSGAVSAMREVVADFGVPPWWGVVKLCIWDDCRKAGLTRQADAIAYNGKPIEEVCRDLARLLRDARMEGA